MGPSASLESPDCPAFRTAERLEGLIQSLPESGLGQCVVDERMRDKQWGASSPQIFEAWVMNELLRWEAYPLTACEGRYGRFLKAERTNLDLRDGIRGLQP